MKTVNEVSVGSQKDLIYFISGMWCSTCAKNIRESVTQIEGIESADLNYASKLLIVKPSYELPGLDESIQEKIIRIGFGVKKQSDGWIASYRERLQNEANRKIPWVQVSLVWFLAMWSSMLAFAGYIGGELSQGELHALALASSFFGLPAILIGIYPFAKAGVRALWFSRLLTLDFFIFVGGCSAVGVSIFSLISNSSGTYADSGSMIVAILLLTKKIENSIVTSTTSNILYQIRSDSSLVEIFRKGTWAQAEASQVKKNDIVRFSPEDTVAFDGALISDTAPINNHLMSGESDVITLKKGDHIFAGAIAKSRIEMSVLAPQGARKIDAWAESAVIGGGRESRYSRILAKAESALVMVAFLGALTIASVHAFRGNKTEDVIESFFVGILIFCPCLFASILPLASQMAYLALLKSGIMLHRSDALLDLSQISNFYFDKTGTLEAVDSIFMPFKNGKENDVLPYLKSISEKASHAILRGLNISGESNAINDLREFAGLGGVAKADDGALICVGKESFLESQGVDVIEYEDLVGTLVSLNGEIVGEIVSKSAYDTMARRFLERLLTLVPDSRIEILSGDPKAGAGKALTQIDPRISFLGNLSPSEKAESIRANAVFVGDGLNDTLALSRARVSFRLGHRISGFAPVDFELRSPNLDLILSAIKYSKKFRRVLVQTGCAAAVYNVAALVLASLGVFSPLGAVLSMLGSFSLMLLSTFRLNVVEGVKI